MFVTVQPPNGIYLCNEFNPPPPLTSAQSSEQSQDRCEGFVIFALEVAY